jgi:hypothetical protein
MSQVFPFPYISRVWGAASLDKVYKRREADLKKKGAQETKKRQDDVDGL